jgi:hypothetical protein
MQNDDKALKSGVQADAGVPQSGPAPNARKDKRNVHTTHHGVLSRHPLEALAKSGENIRELRCIERMLRAELQPTGIIGEILFDRAWSSFLRCLLIARAEKNILAAEEPVTFEERVRRAGVMAAVTRSHKTCDDQPGEVLRNLSISQRYDCHFSREFFRALGMLLALRSAGNAGLTHLLTKSFAQNKDISVED